MWNLSSILDNLDGAVKEAVDETRGPQLSATEIRMARRSDGYDGGRRSPFEEGTNSGEEVTHHHPYPGAPFSSSSTATSSSSSSYNDHGGADSTVFTASSVHQSSLGEVAVSGLGSGSGRRSPFENQGMPISPAPKAEGRVAVKTRPKVTRTNTNANTHAAAPEHDATGQRPTTRPAAQVKLAAPSVPLSVPAQQRHQSKGPSGIGMPAAVALGAGTSGFGALPLPQRHAGAA